MNIKHEMILNAFDLNELYYNIEKAYSFSNEMSEESAFAVFIDELLEKHNLIKYIGDYRIRNGNIDDINKTFRDIGECRDGAENKPILDIYSKSNHIFMVFTYLESNKKEIEETLSLSALKYYFGYKHIQEVEDDLEYLLNEYEGMEK